MWLNLQSNFHNHSISHYNISSYLHYLTQDYVFRIKLTIIKSIRDIHPAPNTLIIKHLNYNNVTYS
jgi:hypothetical protein